LPDTKNFFQYLGCLQRPHHACHSPKHACLGAAGHQPFRRRFGIKATIARPFRIGVRFERGQLTFKPKHRGGDQRPSGQHTRIGNQEAGRKIIRSVANDVVSGNQLSHVGHVQADGMRHNIDQRVDLARCCGRRIDFGHAESGCGVCDLALKVGKLDHVVIDNADGSHAGRSKVERQRAAEAPCADQQNSGRAQPCLACSAHFGKQNMARIAGNFFFAKIKVHGFKIGSCTVLAKTPISLTMAEAEDKALVLFSGGQDSTICLAWALARYAWVETVGFTYGQRHLVELACRSPIRAQLSEMKDWGKRLGPDHMVDLTGAMKAVGATALTEEADIRLTEEGLPNTFVPGRNLLFFTAAAAIAYRRGLRRIVGGMCETDFSGYPDCRDDTIKAMQLALNLGMQRRFVLETPLMWKSKAESFELAHELGGAELVALVVESTHSCYLGERSTLHPWGYGCGQCPACLLRAKGWEEWQARFPTEMTER